MSFDTAVVIIIIYTCPLLTYYYSVKQRVDKSNTIGVRLYGNLFIFIFFAQCTIELMFMFSNIYLIFVYYISYCITKYSYYNITWVLSIFFLQVLVIFTN